MAPVIPVPIGRVHVAGPQSPRERLNDCGDGDDVRTNEGNEGNEGKRERGKEGRREGGKEGKRERGKEGKREGGKEGKRERGKEGRRERGKEGKRAGKHERRRECDPNAISRCASAPRFRAPFHPANASPFGSRAPDVGSDEIFQNRPPSIFDHSNISGVRSFALGL
jgi:hypothetical protein